MIPFECIMCLRSIILVSELLQAQQAQKTRKNQNSNSSRFITVLSYLYVIYSASTHTQGMHVHPQLVNGIYRSTNNNNNNNGNNNSYNRFQERNTDHDSCYNNDNVLHRQNLNQSTCMSSRCHRNLSTINGITIYNTNSTANNKTNNVNIIMVMLRQCSLKVY